MEDLSGVKRFPVSSIGAIDGWAILPIMDMNERSFIYQDKRTTTMSTPETEPAPPPSTRDAILEAALGLFVEHGYHGTSMRQIADRARIALGGIYNHFPGKEALFTAIIRERHPIARFVPVLQQARGETAEGLLRDGAHHLVESLGRDQRLLRLMFVEMVEFDGAHLGELYQQLFPQIALFMDRLNQARGRLRPYPPAAVVRAYFGLIFSYAMFELTLSTTPIAGDAEMLDRLIDILCYGLLAAGPQDARPAP
jgi:AcrR family transcriptional regulator